MALSILGLATNDMVDLQMSAEVKDIICPMCNTTADYKIKDEIGAYCYCSFVVEIEDRKVDSILKLLRSKRCECLDLEGDELMALIRKDERLAHMSCEWAGLDWIIELIEKEQK